MFFPSLISIATKKVISLTDNQSLQYAVDLMDQQSLRDLVITGQQGLRMLTARELIAFRLQEQDFNQPLGCFDLQPVNSLPDDASVIEGLNALKQGSFEYLCLLDKQGNLSGIVSYSDLAAHLEPGHLTEFKRIRDIMHLSCYLAVDVQSSLKNVLLTLRDHQQTAAIIERNHQAVGIVTQRDITHALAENMPSDMLVERIMVSPLVTVNMDVSVQDALNLSRSKKIKRLAVVKGGQVQGILHQKDLVALVYDKWRRYLGEQQRHLQVERELFKQGPVLLFIWHPEGNWPVRFVSENVKNILGYSSEELTDGRFEFAQIVHPDDFEQTKAELSEAIAAQRPFINQSYRVFDKQGKVHWLMDYTRPMYDDEGRVTNVYGYLLDETDQIETKRQAQDSKAQLELALDASETGFWVWDLTTNAISWSDQAFAILGYAPQAFQVSLESFQAKVHPDDIQLVFAKIEQQIASNRAFSVQFRFKNAKGSWTWLEGRGKVTRHNAKGEPIEVMGVQQNITAAKLKDKALKEQTALYLNLVEQHPFFINRFLPDTTTLYCNQTLARFFGATQEQIQGVPWADMLPSPTREEALAALASCTPEQPVQEYINQVTNAEGQLRDVKWTMQAFFDDDSQVQFFQSVGQDITDELALAKQLKAAQVEAEQANQAKSEFLANMSHEIRTPINGIIGLSEMALNTNDLAQVHLQLQKIASSSQLLLGIINDILDFSKVEAGKLQLDPQPFVLDSILDGFKSLFESTLKDKPIEFIIEADVDTKQTLIADSMRLRQVLLNLLSNAFKFTKQGMVTLRIDETKTHNQQTCLTFSVTDTGIGMTEAQQQNLFKAFTQADTSITREHGGTGLGLVISQRLVSLMGAEQIEVASQWGEGSCFRFTLPVQLADSSANTAEASANLTDTHQSINITNLVGQVLLVEDNPINQEVAGYHLASIGLNYSLAENGQEAVDRVKSESFDLILMDIQMPVMDGYQATRAIRSFNDKIPIIALTAAAMIEDKQKALAAGMNEHLSKPINRAMLYQVLEHYLQKVSANMEHNQNTAESDETGEACANPTVIDCQQGLVQLGGNEALYKKLLAKFYQQLSHDYINLVSYLKKLAAADSASVSEETWTELQQQNHALKGVAGNLALSKLYQTSQAIDMALKQRSRPADDLITSFEEAFSTTQQALSDIDRAFSNSSGEPAAQSDFSQADLIKLLDELLVKVNDSQYIAEDELAHIEQHLPSANRDDWQQIMAYLDDFDFDQAAIVLSKLIKSLKLQQP
ncbi:PAS domain-containing protein [Thiomicrospira sp. ALE5]|uniref:PAS domain-containing protein n=1 Tax=Thiomicrospira sp. ALE5 TaxID=748650 RepID=UPI0008E0BAC8|nr:PAS domain-containing protein [Thiomicrospira sp. ALE5]SFR52526.1 PAS domain S-box-containing protein [Thiomicrospira sp. ALE5]